MGASTNFSESSKLFVNIVMASLIVGSSVARCAAATVSRTVTRALSTTAAVKKESKMMDTFDHAVGPEKFELIAKQQGNDDPIIVNALDQYRMVGCSCKEGDTTIQWFWLIAGKDKRCGCGHWFRLKEHAPVDLYDMPA